RHIFAIAAFYGLTMIHADAKTAFLNGDSDLELYVEQPEGFIDQRYPKKVLRLNKSLYGLKQAPRIWFLLVCTRIIEYGFTACESDPSIYFCNRRKIIIAVYVDDMLIIGQEPDECINVYTYLAQQFNLVNLGPSKTFLGLNISRNYEQCTLTIHQTGYIERMLQRFNMTNASPTKT